MFTAVNTKHRCHHSTIPIRTVLRNTGAFGKKRRAFLPSPAGLSAPGGKYVKCMQKRGASSVEVTTSKYTWLSFLPLVTFEQFQPLDGAEVPGRGMGASAQPPWTCGVMLKI